MQKFRKRPVVIEAFQYTKEYYDNFFGTKFQPTYMQMYETHAIINTLEGEMKASLGDWIITGVSGEHYPCKPDIFEKTYEPVDESECGCK